MYAIASILKRKVVLPKSIVGYDDIYPNLFIKFVGPAGLRKTASIEKFVLPLIRNDPTIHEGASFFTKETFMTDLALSSDSSCSLVVGEFGQLMQKNKPAEMYDFLIKLFDGSSSSKLDVSTFKRGKEVAYKPCVNMVTATTRSWIAENMTANAVSGGYSSRIIYVHENKLRDNGRLIYRKVLRETGLDRKKYEEMLVDDLLHMSSMKGEFDMSDEVEDYMNAWYERHKPIAEACSEKLSGYYARKPLMIQKLSMIHAIATSNDLVITKENWDFAVASIESTEGNVDKIFSSMGKNEDVMTIHDIEDFINTHGVVPFEKLMREFMKDGNESKIIELLNTGVSAGLFGGRKDSNGELVAFALPKDPLSKTG